MLETGRAEAGHVVSVTRSGVAKPLLELGPLRVTKASTFAEYARTRGIDQVDVVVFGDMPNDVEMLRWAGHGFAMHGGHHEALAAAPHVAPPVENDGVAQVLETFLAPAPPSRPPATAELSTSQLSARREARGQSQSPIVDAQPEEDGSPEGRL